MFTFDSSEHTEILQKHIKPAHVIDVLLNESRSRTLTASGSGKSNDQATSHHSTTVSTQADIHNVNTTTAKRIVVTTKENIETHTPQNGIESTTDGNFDVELVELAEEEMEMTGKYVPDGTKKHSDLHQCSLSFCFLSALKF